MEASATSGYEYMSFLLNFLAKTATTYNYPLKTTYLASLINFLKLIKIIFSDRICCLILFSLITLTNKTMSIIINLLAVTFVLIGQTLLSQLPPTFPEYELVFYDEFDTFYPNTVINDSLWARTPDWNQSSNLTGNLGYCTPEPNDSIFWDIGYIIREKSDTTTVNVSNGICKLSVNQDNYLGEVWNWPNNIFTVDTLQFKYTRGMLISKHKFRYGYYEVRFRLPPAPASPYNYQGVGPNFWLYGQDTTQNNWWSEIDAFEINADGPLGNNFSTCNVHYANSNAIDHPYQSAELGNITSSEWHKSAIWWTPEFIKIYFNDSLVNLVINNPLIPVDSLVEMPIFLDINAPTTNYCTNFDTVYTQLPYVYEIDYIRVYQLKQDCQTDKYYCNLTGTTFESGLYKSLTIGGVSCNIPFTGNTNVSGLGNDFVLLDEGYYFDNTSQGYFDVLQCDPKQTISLRTSVTEAPPISWLRKFSLK